ncbi:oligosaccharide flippase family protein [Patescibacteria group bacterium]|nr:oligosaccharide flippase family protein [Patescibacteria group bacterium]
MDETVVEERFQDEIDIEAVKRRSVKGVVALTSRTLFLQVISFVATFLLTVFLSPREFGVFFVVSAVVNFLVYFSDIGLAAALIQRKERIKEEDLATTFTIQQILVLTLVGISLSFSSRIAGFYGLSPAGLALLRALIVAFFLSSLKTIPSIILERRLQFNKLIIPQIVENILFYSTAVYLAWQGRGVDSFTTAVLIRGISGVVVIYALEPWIPKFAIKRKSAKQLLSFGIPFQVNSLLALVKDDMLIAYLGKVLPLAQVGFIGWAQRWALMPLRFFSDSIIKVTFPAYSRLQHDSEQLKRAVEKSIFAVATVVFPSVVGLISIAPALIRIIPGYEKWQPALISLALFGVNALWASLSTTLTNTLNATGRIKTSLKLMVMWTALTWGLTPLLIFWIGFNGVALASAITATTSIVAVYLVKRILPIQVLPNITAPIIGTAVMGTFVYALSPIIATSIVGIAALVLLAAILYVMLILLFAREKVFQELSLVRQYLRKK